MTALPGETYRLAFPTLPDIENPPWVSYGRSHHEACAHHVKNTYNAKRAYIIASGSLSKNTDEVEKLKTALGDRLAGVYPGFKPHTPWDEVLEASKDAKEKGADCLITIGGGSLVDGAKAMLLFMANNTTTIPEIYEMHKIAPAALNKMGTLAKDIDIVSPTMPLICIPTTLSGGQYSCYGGGTHPETHHKLVLEHPFMGPRLIINDPKLSITAPEWVWLSTGVRAIDHCVESYCRMYKEDDTDADEATLEAFKKIVPNLLITKKDGTNEEARLKPMLGEPGSHHSEKGHNAWSLARYRTSTRPTGRWPRPDVLHPATERDEVERQGQRCQAREAQGLHVERARSRQSPRKWRPCERQQ